MTEPCAQGEGRSLHWPRRSREGEAATKGLGKPAVMKLARCCRDVEGDVKRVCWTQHKATGSPWNMSSGVNGGAKLPLG